MNGSTWQFHSGECAPQKLVATLERRLGGLAYPDVRLIAEIAPAVEATSARRVGFTEPEVAAASHYEAQGYEVVRLSHFQLCAVGQDAEMIIRGAAELAVTLRRILQPSDFALLTDRTPEVRKALVLNGVDPRHYSLSSYPPDFLCSRRGNPGDWFFAEVKGPGDVLHIRQANWLVHLKPLHWRYEVCMLMKDVADGTLLHHPGESFAGPAFQKAFAVELADVRDFNWSSRGKRP